MLTVIVVLLLLFVLYNFTHISAIQHAYHKDGFAGALKLSFALVLHSIGGIFFK